MNSELLAPAGSPAMLTAAIKAGADAVYFGVGPFHARSLPQTGKPSASFQSADLAGIISQAQHHGLKTYLTLNTLIEEAELDRALTTASAAVAAGISTILVQDLGLALLLHQQFPPRELSLEQIKSFTQAAAAFNIETEVFVQGALCVACSGACLLSFYRGGRSANRGACAQPCRLPWHSRMPRRTSTCWSTPC